PSRPSCLSCPSRPARQDINCLHAKQESSLRRVFMIRRVNGRHAWVLVCAGIVALGLASSAAAQTTGMVKGLVRDDKGQPVDGAKITIEFTEGVNRKQETKTIKKGEFVQIGLLSGTYNITAEQEAVGSQSFDERVRI